MTEPLSPFEPDGKLNSPTPPPHRPQDDPPGKIVCTFLGFALFVGSCFACILTPIMFILGFVLAIVSLFFRGYRCIFLGYILTLGFLLLSITLYCSLHPFHM